jgi:hypothetical protein
MGYSSEVLADSPVAYYKMRESSGLIQDSSGNANHATSSSGSLTYLVPSAIRTDDGLSIDFPLAPYFNVTDHATLQVGDTFTVEAWVRRASTAASDYQTIAVKGSFAFHFVVNGGDGGKLELHQASVGLICASTVGIGDTKWHHAVATKSGASVFLYLDTTDVSGSVTDRTCGVGGTFQIGAQNAGALPFDGGLDELALYGTVLSPQRVLAHYLAATKPGDYFQSGSLWP